MSKKTWKALKRGRGLKREPERSLKLLLPWVRFSILGKLELWILTAFWGGRGRNQHLVAPKLRSLRGGSLHLAGPTESDNSELGWNRSKFVSVSPPRDSESFPCLTEQEGGRDFPGGPVAETPRFPYSEHRLHPWLESWDPECHMVQPKNKKGEKIVKSIT